MSIFTFIKGLFFNIEKEEQEIEIISSFLPKQLDQDETENIISNLICILFN